MATQSTIKDGVLGNTSILSTSGKALTYDEWLLENGSQLTGKSPEEKRKLYQDYINGVNSQGSNPSLTNPQFTDNSNAVSTTNKTDNSRSNVDLLGLTDTFTHLGIATGNSNIVKIGALANTGISTFQKVRELKGLIGVDKTAGVAGISGGAADTLDNVFFGDQRANNSNLTNGLNDAYDMASSAIMTMGPYGAIIGGAMKVGGLLSDGLTAMGVGTDQMTTTDKILDSKFMKLTPVGLVNGIFSSTSDKFSVDNDVRSQIGGSYGGAYAFMDDAASKAGKEYGLFSSGARDDANEQIGRAKVMQGQIGRINKNARDKRSIATSNSDLLTTNYMFNLAGGYDQRYIRAAKEGSKIQRIKKINITFRSGGQINNIINVDTKEIEWQPVIQEFKDGGSVEFWEPSFQTGGKLPFIEWYKGLKEKGAADSLYDYRLAYDTFTDEELMNHYNDPSTYHLRSIGKANEKGEQPFLKLGTRKQNKELEGEFNWQKQPEGIEFMKTHKVIFRDGRYWYVPKKEKGGKLEKEEPLTSQKNVIPEGALHARKHHMENADNLTKKGIPVVTDEGEQQAEIELNEIIFSLEVTKKLEELCADGSDEAAIEAGKLLVKEILYNTDDRTGLINTLKNGGKIDDWIPSIL